MVPWSLVILVEVVPFSPGGDTIERATCRIRESEPYLEAPLAPDVRTRNARRVRNAVRVALRQIERLSVKPEQWVIDRLGELEALTDDLIETLSAAEELILH